MLKTVSQRGAGTATSAAKPSEPQWLKLESQRTLLMERSTTEGRQPHLAAASGLVKAFGKLWVMTDDENAMAVFDGARKGQWVTLLPGTLPVDYEQRREVKPDFESVTELPPFSAAPNGALFTLGSGSAANRTTAALVPVGANGEPLAARTVDVSRLFERLEREVKQLNIEGSVVVGERLRLFNRGGPAGDNAMFDLDLPKVMAAIANGEALTSDVFVGAIPVDLGDLGGVPLGFTDASALPDGTLVFTAAAEATDDPKYDGAVTGSVIGVMSPDGELRAVFPVKDLKLEGIHAEVKGGDLDVTMVIDADDPTIASPLLHAVLPGLAPRGAEVSFGVSEFTQRALPAAGAGVDAAAFTHTVNVARSTGWELVDSPPAGAKKTPVG